MLSHVQEDDDSDPYPAADGYEYWRRTRKGSSFAEHWRRRVRGTGVEPAAVPRQGGPCSLCGHLSAEEASSC